METKGTHMGEVTEITPNGGTNPDGSKRVFGRWTFEYPPAREFVERHLHGRVLNACAGKTKLSAPQKVEIVRNDLNEAHDADLHVDVSNINEHFEPSSFDVIIFDPPFDDTQAEDKYDGMRADSMFAAWEAFETLAKPGCKVITFGWNSWGMTSFETFERIETHLLQRGPCLRDVIITVDKRTTGTIQDAVQN